MYGQLMAGGKQFVHCREVVLLSECPLLEVLLYMHMYLTASVCVSLCPIYFIQYIHYACINIHTFVCGKITKL